jgi:acyl-CoA reductase-like NAD-dependent aldehyde dehydrogenase
LLEQRWDYIFGSVAVGKIVAKAAIPNTVTLELEGKAPVLLMKRKRT